MEQNNDKYTDILNMVIEGTTNEDKIAEVFSINLDDEETEKKHKQLIESMYEEYCTQESTEKGKGASVIADYIGKFKALAESNKPSEPQPKLTTSQNGSYVGFFLAPLNHLQRITDALLEMAKTDEELANAIAEGKKTFEGCDRFIKNNMKDIARELKADGAVTYEDEAVHAIARWYMVNPDAVDVQNAVKSIKTETKKKTESKPKKETKVVPLTPQMGSLFTDEDFQN